MWQIFRGWKARMLAALLRKQVHAATLMQALWRMRLGKKRVLLIKRQRVLSVKVQAFWRGYFVRATRYRHIRELHEAWGRGITAINRHVRGWLGRREAVLVVERRTRGEFDRRQAELDVILAAASLAQHACHRYLQTPQGLAELAQEQARLKESGRFRRTTLAPFQLVDRDLLRAGLRHVFELFDLAGTGHVSRQELRDLIAFTGVVWARQPAEVESALQLSDDTSGRLLDFEGFCDWYHDLFRYGPTTWLARLHRRLQRRAMPFARRTIMRRHCLTSARRVADTMQGGLQGPAACFACLQCRQPFLRYRRFMSHFVGKPDEAVKGPRHFCPVTGGIGLLAVGYLGGRQAFDLQKRVNRELMRQLDEQAVVQRAVHAAEAEFAADLPLPQPTAELQTLTRALELAYPPDSLKRDPAKDALAPQLLPGQLRLQKCAAIAHCKPRARRLGERVNRQWGFNYLKRKGWDRRKAAEMVRRRQRQDRLRRGVRRLLAKRPCSRAVVCAVFEVFKADELGVDVRDLPQLFAALKLRFTWRAKAAGTPRALKATFAPGSERRVGLDVFYRWYVTSNGHLFRNGFDVPRQQLPAYLARQLMLRRSMVAARQAALDSFRQVRAGPRHTHPPLSLRLALAQSDRLDTYLPWLSSGPPPSPDLVGLGACRAGAARPPTPRVPRAAARGGPRHAAVGGGQPALGGRQDPLAHQPMDPAARPRAAVEARAGWRAEGRAEAAQEEEGQGRGGGRGGACHPPRRP